MSKKTLKFANDKINQNNFILLRNQLLPIQQIKKIVISDKSKRNDNDSKYFIGYKDDNFIRPSCIILPQMKRYLKNFDGAGNYVF